MLINLPFFEFDHRGWFPED